jgi:hypothetical protein
MSYIFSSQILIFLQQPLLENFNFFRWRILQQIQNIFILHQLLCKDTNIS